MHGAGVLRPCAMEQQSHGVAAASVVRDLGHRRAWRGRGQSVHAVELTAARRCCGVSFACFARAVSGADALVLSSVRGRAEHSTKAATTTARATSRAMKTMSRRQPIWAKLEHLSLHFRLRERGRCSTTPPWAVFGLVEYLSPCFWLREW